MDILVFLGSVRDSTPPKPARLGHRVALACQKRLEEKGLTPSLVDPLDHHHPPPFKPHFAYASGRAPQDLEDLAGRIERADAFVMVSPEYNHGMSPALADLLNHFGASLFAWKPSAIVTYSAGQWGGARAAMAMRPFLSELGCLPVSAMVHVPHAQDVWDAEGAHVDPAAADRWNGYLDRSLDQLIWWAEAAQARRADPSAERTPAFRARPQDRDAP
ncbi:NADPH-dependent oxidoreductase [Falsirhodobacter algicola]|uniref:NADPH-dependent oxidoreductase n=1 Tax=Falsirhodobacter algicola TaxID=2692330 RepID=A0A8J8MUJ2_9RHOB|nr:NADPH-dependent oxidoreductase [Falsirhodobacter algicola]